MPWNHLWITRFVGVHNFVALSFPYLIDLIQIQLLSMTIYSRIQRLSFVRLWSQISTSLLVARFSYCNSSVWSIQEDHPSLSNRGSINSIPPSVGCSPRLSWFYSNCYFNQIGKEELKFDLLKLNFKSIQTTASSWRQISKSSWLYIFISIRIFQLLWNICDCFFHRAAWVIIWALLVRRVYNGVYGQFPPHFTLFINHLNFSLTKVFQLHH